MRSLTALAHAVVLSSGWRRRALALVAGACGALAMAPLDIAPAMLVPLCVAVWLVDGTAGGPLGPALRAVAADGWWLGFGYFVAGLWWLGAAFLVEPDQFAWALPLGVVGVPAGLALFWAFGLALSRALWVPGPTRVFALALGLGVAEWLRGHVLTGFPWNEIGMALGNVLPLAQLGALMGMGGLSLVTLLIGAAPATLAEGRRLPSALALAALAGIAGFGVWRLGQAVPPDVPDVRLRVVQPNLPQDARFSPGNKDEILDRYLAVSDQATSPTTAGIADATVLVWPESAFPFILSRDPSALTRIGGALGLGRVLLTGAARVNPPARGGQPSYFNSIQAVAGGEGRIVASADKVHLVPFGEYLPFDGVLRRLGVQNFVHIPGGFTAGTSRGMMDVPGLPPIAPLVCYEAIFSGEVMPEGPRRPGVFLNVTNDGWFGETSGPWQHLAQARLRSIEEGLPMVRSASTGVSAVIDPFGRILQFLPLGRDGVIDAPLPGALPPTVFGQHGRAILGWMYGALALLTVAGFGASRWRRRV